MRTDLSIGDLGAFLDEPRVAVLATTRADGTILLSPVWHEWRDGGFDVWVGVNDVKARHLRREPRATIIVAESEVPLRGVEVRTTVEVVTEGVRERAIAIASRYIGRERGEAYFDSMAGDQVILRFAPGELRVWDFADEYGAFGPPP